MKYFTMDHLDRVNYNGMLNNYNNNALMYNPIKSVSDIYDNAVEIQNTLFDDEDHGYHKGRQFRKRNLNKVPDAVLNAGGNLTDALTHAGVSEINLITFIFILILH